MSKNFNANQYEGEFVCHKLQNWEVSMKHKGDVWFNNHYIPARPKAQEGFTEIIANDRGHILEGYPKSGKNPWGNFVGTWDMPKKIPGNCATVDTARRPDAEDRLRRHLNDAQQVMSGTVKNTVRQTKGKSLPANRRIGAYNPTPIKANKPLSGHRAYHSVTMDPEYIQSDYKDHKIYPKTYYPTDTDYRDLTPLPNYGGHYSGFTWDPARHSRPQSNGSVELVQINAL